MGVVLVVLAVGSIAITYRRSLGVRLLPEGLLQLNGRLEGDDVRIASKVPGRLHALLARDGDVVRAGQTVALLEDGTARARLDQAIASRDVAVARASAAAADLAVVRKEVPIAIDSAQAELRGSEASIEQATLQEAQTRREADRTRALLASRSLDAETNERATLAHDTALQRLVAARAARDKANAALGEARLGRDRIHAKEAEVAALDAAARQAAGLLEEARTAVDDLEIRSPIDGMVTTRFVDLGEVVSAGTPLLEVVDLDRLYLKAFVPESDIGKVHLGAAARVYTDAFPGRATPAVVRYVASRAEFTPKEVQTRDERVKLVYTVKLYIAENRDRHLVPGLGADAIVRWREQVPWATPR